MTTFKCLRSNNLVAFTNEDDIAQLRKHEGYVEVKQTEIKHEEEVKKTAKEIIEEIPGTITLSSIKKRGRPVKIN